MSFFRTAKAQDAQKRTILLSYNTRNLFHFRDSVASCGRQVMAAIWFRRILNLQLGGLFVPGSRALITALRACLFAVLLCCFAHVCSSAAGPRPSCALCHPSLYNPGTAAAASTFLAATTSCSIRAIDASRGGIGRSIALRAGMVASRCDKKRSNITQSTGASPH
jgi:hypothetical protein